MENQLDQLKLELVQEIKELAAEIAKSNSFVGMLSQEIKFKTLHEKLINLKFLERKHIGLDVFDQPIPMHDEKDEVYSTSDERYEDEIAQEYDFQRIDINQQEKPFSPEISNDFEENVTQFSHDRIKEIDQGIENEEFSSTTQENNEENEDPIDVETSVEQEVENPQPEPSEFNENDVEIKDESSKEDQVHVQTFDEEIKEYAVDFAEFLPKSSSLPKIQIDFNDRIAFLHQLFDGDSEGMDLVFNTLNHLESLSDSRSYLKDLIREMDWNDRGEYIDRLEELVQKRFD